MERFAERPCYAGVSWGKDSLVVAHLAWRLMRERGVVIPLVWGRVEPIGNPDCEAVRDAFLSTHPGLPYHETSAWCVPHHQPDDEKGIVHDYGWTARGTLEEALSKAHVLVGSDRYVSGIRGAESGQRKARMRAHGVSTEKTCAPLGYWTARTVFAYLHHYDLPVHPAYACMGNGVLWERERLRVSVLGRVSGQGHGRWDWEWRYYGDRMRELTQMAKDALS